MKRPNRTQHAQQPMNPRVAELFAQKAIVPLALPSMPPKPVASVSQEVTSVITVPALAKGGTSPDVIFVDPPKPELVVEKPVLVEAKVEAKVEPVLVPPIVPDTADPVVVASIIAATATTPDIEDLEDDEVVQPEPPQACGIRVWLKPISESLKTGITRRTYRIGEFAFWQENCAGQCRQDKANIYLVNEDIAKGLCATGEIERVPAGVQA